MAYESELPIIRACYDFVLWLSQEIGKFPRDQRFVLGERMQRQTYDLLENLIRAKYSRLRRPLLEQLNVDLEVLRFQIRLAKDLSCLTIKKYGTAAEHITDIGRQIGGWLKQSPAT